MEHFLEEIVQSEAHLQHAMLANDVPTLERLLHDELLFPDIAGKWSQEM